MAIKNVTQLEDLSLGEGETVTHFFAEDEILMDGVSLYAREHMFMGMIWYSFIDAISEGDGPAVT